MNARLLQKFDAEAAVDVLSSAFAGDPLLVWACGTREQAGMRASCRMNIALWTQARSAYGWFERERLVAVALYQKPREHVSTWRALRAGFWRMPFAAGLVATQRIIHTFAVAEQFKASLLGKQPYFYLDTLGVQQSAARRGLGPRLLIDSLSDLRERAPLPCFLLTHLPENVQLYERLGFSVLDQCAVPKTPITFWGMQQLRSAL